MSLGSQTDQKIQFDSTACLEEPIRGPCRALLRRYFYNSVVNECREFFYGGCGGNENNFLTKFSCESACRRPNIGNDPRAVDCRLPLDSGPCRGYFPRWAFNGVSCQEFVYGGCGGNWNRFETKDDCETTCASSAGAVENQNQQSIIDSSDRNFPTPPPFNVANPTGGSLAPVCTWPLIPGPCRGYFLKWGFQGDHCVEFVYGGCGGNANRFDTKAECEKSCAEFMTPNGGSLAVTGQVPPGCNLPLMTGPCRGYFPRWGFDGTKCVQFVYGGCQGNINNFDSEEQCRLSCMSSGNAASKGCLILNFCRL